MACMGAHEVEINNSDRYRINMAYSIYSWERWGEYILST